MEDGQNQRESRTPQPGVLRRAVLYLVGIPWRRVVCGGAVGGAACLFMLLVRHWIAYDAVLALNIVMFGFLGAAYGALLPQVCLTQADKPWLKMALLPVLAGVGAAVMTSLLELPLRPGLVPRRQIEALLIEFFGEFANDVQPGLGARVMRLRYLPPILLGSSVAVIVAMCVSCMPRRRFGEVAKRYGAFFLVLAAVRALVPPVFLLVWPRPGALWVGLADVSWLCLFFWAVAVDLGQRFGATRLCRRHAAPLAVAALAVVLVLALAFWKPIGAEYFFWRAWTFEDHKAIARSLTRTYRLSPNDPRNAYAYAMFAVADEASSLQADGHFDAAMAKLREAQSIVPGAPSIFERMSALYRDMGDTERQLACQREAVEAARIWAPEEGIRSLSLETSVRVSEKRLIDVLAHEAGDESVAEIIGFLHNEDDEVVAHATETLAEMGAVQAIPALQHIVDSGEHEDARATARRALEKLGAALPSPPLDDPL